MAERPQTRYVRAGQASIAYQVVGDGPLDVFVEPGGIWHIELLWGDPAYTRFVRRLASFARVILHDKRGMGASDPCLRMPTLDERLADMEAVMEATGAKCPALLGISEGGPAAALWAATRPERTRALVMYGTFAAGDLAAQGDDDYPWEGTGRFWTRAERLIERFGEGMTLELFAAHRSTGELERRMWAAFERTATNPAMVRMAVEFARQIDVRPALPAITAPTLVVHRRDDPLPVEGARYMAARIPGARLVELPGDDHIPWLGDVDGLADEIEEFLTGARAPAPADRILASVLFTDIVGSTERAAQLGDRRWRELLERHDALVRDEVHRTGGRPVKSLGDGFLATFGGPAAAIGCATALVRRAGDMGLEVRAGVHAGECEAIGDDLGGMAVHVGARISELAAPGEVLVSRTVKDLVLGSDVAFEDRGIHALKGVPDTWHVFAVRADGAAPRPVTHGNGAARGQPRLGDRALARAGRLSPALVRGLVRAARRRA